MKTKATFIMLWAFLLLTLNVLSQAPQKFNYQAVVRDDAGNIISDQVVGIKINILQGTVDGTVVYSETHSPTTNSFGLVTIEIGDGTVASGDFTTIDWGSNTHFLKVEMDATGGTTYTEMGASQILSVPYALHSKTAENVFSGDYFDLSNRPTNVSTFTNDAGYLTGFAESDPVFGLHVSSGILSGDIANWNSAFGWGNHATVGYITDGNTGWNNTYGFITPSSSETLTNKSGNISMWTNNVGYLTSFTEDDPIFQSRFSSTIPVDGQLLRFNSGKWYPWTNNFLTSEVDGDTSNELQNLTLTGNDLGLTNSGTIVDLSPYLDNSNFWSLNGEHITFNTGGNVGIGTDTPVGKLEVQGDGLEVPDEPLFEVKRQDGQTVFAVYPEGVRIYVEEESAKGTKGGFAIGGFNPATKGITNEYLRVTPDSVRVYVNDDGTKGTKGGFAIGGFSPVKGTTNEYLRVSPDSVRVYVDGDAAKGTKGGFAIGGINPLKGPEEEYLRVTPDSVRVYINDATTKGTKGGFAIGGFNPAKGLTREFMRVTDDSTRVYVDGAGGFSVADIETGPSINYLDLNPENYLIGHESGQQITNGKYNTFFGFEAGYSTTGGIEVSPGQWQGCNNIFFGYQSGYDNTTGYKNVFIGYKSGANNTSGEKNIFIGNESGMVNVSGGYNSFVGYNSGILNLSGMGNTLFGSNTGFYNSTGYFNTCVGSHSGEYLDACHGNTFIGTYSGHGGGFPGSYPSAKITGGYNTFLGYRSGYYNLTGSNNTYLGDYSGYNNINGSDNVFIGSYAGYNETGNNLLYIDNSSTSTPLIYGNFTSNVLTVNGAFDVTGNINFGDTSPNGKFNVGGNGGIQGVMVINRFTDDGVLIRFRRDGSTQGDISVSSGVVSYNAFTGSHYAWTDDKIEKGMLVSMTGKNQFLEGNDKSEMLYGVTLTNRANDPNVLGAYLSLQNPGQPSTLGNPHMIMAVGNGNIWVVDNGEDLQQGDYLISSTLPGHAMKDNDEYDIAFVIARVAEPIHWAEVDQHIDGKKHKCVSVFFESFTANHQAEKLEIEIENLSNEIYLIKQSTISSMSMVDEINSLKMELETLKRLLGITEVNVNKE